MTTDDDGGPETGPSPGSPPPEASTGAPSTESPPVPESPPLPEEQRGSPVGRRVVLGMLGLGAAGIVFGKPVQDAVAQVLSPITKNDPSGLSSLLPGTEGFRIYAELGSPTIDDDLYRLKVTGLVDRPVTLTLADLRSRLPQTALTKDFQCVTGWRVPDVAWRGVLLSDVLAQAGLQSRAAYVRFTCFDGGYTESLTLAQARRPDVLIAHEMQGKPLSQEHGGPVRLYVAPMYGYKSAKWLSGIEVTDHLVEGYWEENGYDVDAWVGRSNGRDDAPTSS